MKTTRKQVEDDVYIMPRYFDNIRNHLVAIGKLLETSVNWSSDGLERTVIWKFDSKSSYEEWNTNPVIVDAFTELEAYNLSKDITREVLVEEIE